MSNTIRLKNNSRYALNFAYFATDDTSGKTPSQTVMIDRGETKEIPSEVWAKIEKSAKPWMKQGDLIKMGEGAAVAPPEGGDIAHLSVAEAIDFIGVLTNSEARALLELETRDPVRAAIQKKLGGEV